MAELVDALVSGTSDESRGGSSPLLGTKSKSIGFKNDHSQLCWLFCGRLISVAKKILFRLTVKRQVLLQTIAHSSLASRRLVRLKKLT
jgi:hypothetical protein